MYFYDSHTHTRLKQALGYNHAYFRTCSLNLRKERTLPLNLLYQTSEKPPPASINMYTPNRGRLDPHILFVIQSKEDRRVIFPPPLFTRNAWFILPCRLGVERSFTCQTCFPCLIKGPVLLSLSPCSIKSAKSFLSHSMLPCCLRRQPVTTGNARKYLGTLVSNVLSPIHPFWQP